jgi:hypothetical protein
VGAHLLAVPPEGPAGALAWLALAMAALPVASAAGRLASRAVRAAILTRRVNRAQPMAQPLRMWLAWTRRPPQSVMAPGKGTFYWPGPEGRERRARDEGTGRGRG